MLRLIVRNNHLFYDDSKQIDVGLRNIIFDLSLKKKYGDSHNDGTPISYVDDVSSLMITLICPTSYFSVR